MKTELFKILACPMCYRSLSFVKESLELVCKFDSLSFKIHNGVPVFLKNVLENIYKNI